MSLRRWVIDRLPPFLRRYADRLRSSPVWYRLATGTFWVFAGTALARLLALLASVVVARMLGREGFGNLGIIASTVGLFIIFAGLHTGFTATKFVAEFRQKDPQKAGRIIGLCENIAAVTSVIVAAVFFVLAPWLATRTLNAPHLTWLLRIASLQLMLEAFNGAQAGALAGLEAFREQARILLVVGLLAFPMTIGGVYFWGITGATWAMVANTAMSVPLYYLALRKQTRLAGIRILHHGCRSEWPIVWTFTLPAVLTGIAIGPFNWVCNALLVNSPNGYAEMGVLNAVNQWFSLVVFFPVVVGTALLPTVSERIGAKDHGITRHVLTTLLTMTALVGGPVVLVFVLASPALISLYGREFMGRWQPLVVVLVMGWVYAFQTPLTQVIAGAGRMWLAFWMNMVWAAVFLGGTIALLKWGATGVSLAKLAAYVVVTSWSFWVAFAILRRGEKCQESFREGIRSPT